MTKAADPSNHPLEVTPPPAYLQHRIDMYDRLAKEYADKVKSKVDPLYTLIKLNHRREENPH